MTVTWMESIDCAFLPALCCHCQKHPASIWYLLDHRLKPDGGNKDGYKPFCAPCTEHLALGMLRDVAEIIFGKTKADADYSQLMKNIEQRTKRILAILADHADHDTKTMEPPTDKLSSYTAIFEKFLTPVRCTSDKMLQERLAELIGIPVANLNKVVDVQQVKLKGAGVQLVGVRVKK